MNITLIIHVFICLVMTICSQPAQYFGRLVNPSGYEDGTSHTMVKRGMGPLSIIGKGAEEFLLKGAKYKRIDSSGYRLFEKQGRYQTALRNFNAVNPTGMNPINLGRPGNIWKKMKVGDRKIQLLHNNKDMGNRRLPQILISNPTPGELPFKILYKKNIH